MTKHGQPKAPKPHIQIPKKGPQDQPGKEPIKLKMDETKDEGRQPNGHMGIAQIAFKQVL